MSLLKLNGDNIYHKLYSAQEGAKGTVLLIHGLGSSHSFYAPIIPYLLEKKLNCLVVDTPGSGLSVPSTRDRSPKELAVVFRDVLSSVGFKISDVSVVGHSMGAMIASELALLESPKGVVLLGPVHPTPALAGVFEKRIQAIAESGLESLASTIPTAATGSASNALQHAFIRALIQSQTPEGYSSLCRTIMMAEPPKYDQIQCPLLVVAGAEDKTSPLQGCKTIIDSWGASPSAKRLEILDGVGHWHCVEAHEEVAKLVGQFASE